MAFNEQEKAILQWGVENSKSKQEITDAITRFRTTGSPKQAVVSPASQPSGLGEVAKGFAKGLASTIATADVLPTMKKIAGQEPSFTSQSTDERSKAFEALNTSQRVGKGIAFATEIATPLATPAARLLAKATTAAIDTTKEAVARATPAVKSVLTRPTTPQQAAAQIGQGNTKTNKSVLEAMSKIDTADVTTFKQLQSKLDSAVPQYARVVDAELAKDATVYSLAELTAKQSSKGGAIVETDFVSRAMTDLKNLYTSIGDDVAAADVDELIAQATNKGLTRKEVNDISRVYGQEFGSKAFSKLGEPLTSTNAQAFENTRSGLKAVARQGIGGAEAKEADSVLSALYDTKTLIDRNVEAVNKLQQRIQERNLIEKAGYFVAKYADMLTGGSIRGFVGGLLPRGAGYKVMNAIDIEAALRKNLNVIEQALKTESDDALLKTIRQLEPTPPQK